MSVTVVQANLGRSVRKVPHWLLCRWSIWGKELTRVVGYFVNSVGICNNLKLWQTLHCLFVVGLKRCEMQNHRREKRLRVDAAALQHWILYPYCRHKIPLSCKSHFNFGIPHLWVFYFIVLVFSYHTFCVYYKVFIIATFRIYNHIHIKCFGPLWLSYF